MAATDRGGRAAEPAEGAGLRDPAARLLRWRLLLAAVVAGVAGAAALAGGVGSSRPGVLAGSGLLATSLAVSWAALVAGARQRPLLVFQVLSDTVAVGLLVHFTGGPYSVIPLAACVPIVFAATYLDRRWALIVAASASVLVAGGHAGLALGWLAAGGAAGADFAEGWRFVVTALHVVVFTVVGLLSGDLAERLERRRREQARSRRQAEQARREVRDILDCLRSGLLTVDARGIITRVNPAGCRIVGCEDTALLGAPLGTLVEGGLDELARVVLPVAAGGPPVMRGEITLRPRGRSVPVGLNVSHVTGAHDEITGAVAVFTDLTLEKELAARRRETDRLAAVGELAASIAHEIRNPLASIRGSVEMLSGELLLEGYQQQLFDLVLKESARVNSIINDFLAYSRTPPVARRRFAAAGFRDEILLLARQHVAAARGDVRFSAEVTPGDLELVADPGQLTQLALNLAINACEAMRYQGRARLGLHLVDGGESFELTLTDDGPGIEAEIRDSLFLPFKTTKEGGTGLGLSVVARIAAAHGGTVRAEDAPGGGAIFRVRWPGADLVAGPKPSAGAPGPAPGRELHPV
ncbi:PAS domain-containing protein [bacterium]|nr:PAS domain-containing protein [bacterium]